MNSLIVIVLFIVIQTVVSVLYDNETNIVNDFYEEKEESRVLSRRKRFITFPDGSSLQLVFLIQTPLYIPIGDIFLYGLTSGLAWVLPTDPLIFDTLKKYGKPLRRSDVVKTINYLDEEGRLIAKVPYERRPIVNPTFGKRSIEDNLTTYKEKLKQKVDRKKMHEKHMKTNHLKIHHSDKDSLEFHRSKRAELYQKIEKLLTVIGRDGRLCVLYKLCEAAQRAPRQGTFLQEFLKAVFTLPKGEEFQYEEHKEYDKAHVETENCLVRYPGCEELHESVLF